MRRRRRDGDRPLVHLSNVVAGGGVHVTIGGFVPAVPRQLPPPLPDFTGRTAAVAAVEEGLLRGSRRVAVVGPGGAGKSALAVHVAHRLRDRFPDGQFHLDLRASRHNSAAELAAGMLLALGMPAADVPADPAACIAAYRSGTAERRILLIVDNVDRMLDVRELVPVGEGSAFLLASRNAEVTVEGVLLVRIAEMDEGEAATLLGRASGRSAGGSATGHVLAVVHRCGALPLALRICGALLAARPHWSFEELAEHLREERKRLDRLQVGDLGVRASFNISMRELDRAHATAFRLGGAVPGPVFTAPLMDRVLAPEPDDTPAEVLLDGLVARSLVESFGDRVYRFHELLGLFAREEFESAFDEVAQQQVFERVVGFYVDGFGGVLNVLMRAEQGGSVPEEFRSTLVNGIDIHRFNVAPVLARAVESGLDEQAAFLGFAAGEIAMRRWSWAEAEDYHGLAYQAALPIDDGNLRWTTAMGLANCYSMQGRSQLAEVLLQQAAALAGMGGPAGQQAAATGNLAFERAAAGDLGGAARLHREVLERCRVAGDGVGEAVALSGLGDIERERGRLRRAAHYYERARAVVPPDMPPDMQGKLLGNLGMIKADLSEWDAAHDLLQEARRLHRLGGDLRGELVGIEALSGVAWLRGHHADAIGLFDEMLDVEERMGVSGATAQQLCKCAERGVPVAVGLEFVRVAVRVMRHADRLGDVVHATHVANLTASLAGHMGRRRT